MNEEIIPLLYDLRSIVDCEFKVEKVISATTVLDDLYRYLFKKLFEKNEIHSNIEEKIKNIPNNLADLYHYLYHVPVKEYLEIESDEPFISYYGVVNEKIRNLMQEKDAYDQIHKDIIYPLLQTCRDSHIKKVRNLNWIEIYKNSRLFIETYYFIERRELDIKLCKEFPLEIAEIIEKAYMNCNIQEEVSICPICGKKVEVESDHYRCNSDICMYYINKNNLEYRKKSFAGKVMVVNEAIYNSVILPGIAERKIYEKLKKIRKYSVNIYPAIDEYDISVTCNDKFVNLDVKDVKSPEKLVTLLKQNTKLYKYYTDNTFVVIPTHRIKMYKETTGVDYKLILQNRLQNENIKVRVLNESNLQSCLERIFS